MADRRCLGSGWPAASDPEPDPIPHTFDPDELADHLTGWDVKPYTADDLLNALLRVGRDHGPAVVAAMHAEGALDPRHAPAVVPHVWSSVEHPYDVLAHDMWRALFAFAGFTVNGAPASRPRRAVTLYRGADEAHSDGFSWTDDRDRAEWFARRSIHARPGWLWTAVAEPQRLLARITDGRGEAEWVIDTAGLTISRADRATGRRVAMVPLPARAFPSGLHLADRLPA